MDPNTHPYYTTLPTHRATLARVALELGYTVQEYPDLSAQPAYLVVTRPEPAVLDAVAALLSAEEVPGGD